MMTSQALEEMWIHTAVTAGLGAKWNKLDLVKITLEGNPKMLDHSDK